MVDDGTTATTDSEITINIVGRMIIKMINGTPLIIPLELIDKIEIEFGVI